MKKLRLPLLRRWFEMTISGVKQEDYREITPYWCNRLLLYEGKSRKTGWWYMMMEFEGCFFRKAIEDGIATGKITFKPFDETVVMLGYPKNNDLEKIAIYKHAGITINTGNPEWGAEPGVYYFVIKHGEEI